MTKTSNKHRNERRKVYFGAGTDKKNKQRKQDKHELTLLKQKENKIRRLTTRLKKYKVSIESTDSIKILRKKLYPYTVKPKKIPTEYQKLKALLTGISK